MPYYIRNGKRYYRIANKYGKKGDKIYFVVMILAVTLDVIAGIAVLSNATYVLDLMQTALAPIAWFFNLICIPIRDGYMEGVYPLIYYRVLLLVSALAGTMWCVFITWFWCKRSRFFSNPIYPELVFQRMVERHRDVFRSGFWFYFFFRRGLYISLIYFTVNVLYYMYPGRITFHANKHPDIIVPVIFTLIPAILWSALPVSVFLLISCICNDLRTIRMKLIRH